LIVAEAGVNHGGNAAAACRLVETAAAAGADAVKFQAFAAERLATATAPMAAYQRRAVSVRHTQLDMLRELELSIDAHRRAAAVSHDLGLLFLSTPFDEQSADALAAIGVPAFKLPSGEITNLPLLAHVARKGKPVILSTGMATLGEVDEAIGAIVGAGCNEIVLMHCTSAYPAAPSDANLRAIGTLAAVFDRPCGYSDHTRGHDVTVAAVALGACVVEKHLTLDRGAPGPDHAASLDPAEFGAMVRAVRTAEAALGDGRKRPAASEREIAMVVRRSLVAARAIPAGSVLDEEAVTVRRPGTGLPPGARETVIGRTVRIDIPAGALITLEMLA
jgi:N-acetylneuraminate synthase